MRFLKQSTAFTFRIGPFLDDTDGKTAETALTIAQGDIQISKAGGTFAQTSAAPTTTHDADGWYQCPLTTTDTGTLGALTVQVIVAGALPVWEHFMVLPANVYDSLVGGSDYLQTDVIQVEGSDATDQMNAACDTAISDAALATAANLAIVDGIVNTIVARIIGTIAAGTHTAQTGDSFALIGAAGAGLTNINLPDQVMNITGNITGNLSGSVGSVTGAVGNIAANGITATSMAADAINASAVKLDAVTKIQNGLATPTNITAGTITTVTTVTNMLTAAAVKTAMEASNSDLDYLVTDLVNKKSIKIATGISTQFNDADGSLGAIGTGYSDDGVDVVRPRQVIVK